MKLKHTQSRKGRRIHNSAPYWKFEYNAPVAERRKVGLFGADHLEFSKKHGII